MEKKSYNYDFSVQIFLILADMLLVNIGFIFSFLIRYGYPFPAINFNPYKGNFVFLTFIYVLSLVSFRVYKARYKSSWILFESIVSGLFIGLLISFAFVYVFRIKWSSFPTSVLFISFFVNLLLIFKFNQYILKFCGRIKKKILIFSEGSVEYVLGKTETVKICSDDIQNLSECTDVDEIFIFDVPKEKDMGFITCLAQKLRIKIIFSPECYINLLPEKINGNNSDRLLLTFIGRKREAEEFAMRSLDVIGSLTILMFSLPFTLIAALLIKLTSNGPVIYKQQRVGKDGKIFTLYKFRTMIDNAEKEIGPVLALENDPRVTKIGRFLRDTRLDEFPQLINVILGQMSLVGPRPERPYFVKRHKALMEIRLAVRPGLTGLAQIRNVYDLHPNHKIKYDYLYIQQRSLLLNLYILAKTIPVMLLKKGQ